MQIRRILVAFIVLLLLVTVGCAQRSGPVAGGELVIGAQADVETLDPHMLVDLYSRQVVDQLFDTLVRLDYSGNYVAALATHWEVSDDGLVWTFDIRPDVLCHDGEPLTPDDVVFSLQRILDPDLGSPRLGSLSVMQQVEPVGTDQVQVQLGRPNGALLSLLLNVHIIPERSAEDVARQPMGSGPFQLKSRDPGERIVLSAFDDYWAGRPLLDSVVFRPIPEVSTRLMELEVGAIHLMDRVPGEERERLSALDDVEIASAVGSNYSMLAMNNTRAPFADERVRQAIAHAVDKDRLVNLIYPGTAVRANGPLPPSSWAYDEDFVGLNFDQDRARNLLEEAGVAAGTVVELLVTDDERMQRDGVLLQSMLEEIGLEVELTVLDWGAFMSRLLAHDYDMLRVNWSEAPEPDSLLFNLMFSESDPLNFTRYKNSRVDELLQAGRVEADVTRRTEIYREVQEWVVSEAPMAFLVHLNELVGYQDSVQDFQPHPTGALYFKTDFGTNTWLKR